MTTSVHRMVYCRATTCRHNQGYHCQIVNPLDGDDGLSLDSLAKLIPLDLHPWRLPERMKRTASWPVEVVRTFLDDSYKPWWVAKDVCEILGLSNPRQALSRISEKHKGKFSMDTLEGNQQMATVDEVGVFMLIMRSDKKKAVEAQLFMAREVLPTLNRTGQYTIPGANVTACSPYTHST